MPPKSEKPMFSGVILGALIEAKDAKKFQEICAGMGSSTTEVISAFIYSVIRTQEGKKQ